MHTVLQHNEKNKHYLMLCELHYPAIHGKTEDSDPNIETHYLVYERFDPISGISFYCLDDDFEYDTDREYESDDDESNDENRMVRLQDSVEFLKEHYSNPANFNPNYFGHHPTIRNYHNIIARQDYIKPEIGEYIILPTQEAIAILKTVWLRIIQRKWKKVFAKRKDIIRSRCRPSSLHEREIYGKWPQVCRNLPGLRGMLNDLKK